MAMRNSEILKQMKLIQIGLPEIPNEQKNRSLSIGDSSDVGKYFTENKRVYQ
jgi:hypothetical protein